MKHYPSFETFKTFVNQYSVVPVYRRLLADELTPVSAFRKIASKADWSFLFESVVGGERIGRYSFLGANPFQLMQATRDQVTMTDRNGQKQSSTHPDPLKALEETLRLLTAPTVAGLPRFCGGAVGFAAYDSVRYLEHLPNSPHDDRQLPDLGFAFYDSMIIFDHVDKTILVVALAHIEQAEQLAKSAYDSAVARVDELVRKLQKTGDELPLEDFETPSIPAKNPASNMSREQYEEMVRQGKEYILAGDIFQVVLSQRFEADITVDPFEVYRALRVVSPSPFMFYVKQGELTLVGASPEIMCRNENGMITNRPLAGTRHRGRTEEEDQKLAEELLADPKERAEHIMLVDLARNDVGRVAEIGSVKIEKLLTVEKYSHVMHISSTVTGKLRSDLTSFDALRTALPAGTLSGAPKVRAMEIIDELEPHRRGPYGGAVGYVDFSGNMDTCIALRTMIIHKGKAYVQAGAGIVADSDPTAEYQETVNKAASLMRALSVAESRRKLF